MSVSEPALASPNQEGTAACVESSHARTAPVGFAGSRWPYASALPVPGSLRIAFVGDSITYGAAVSYGESLSQRVAFHLGSARPDTWFDCLTFGWPGACAFQTLSRAELQVRALAPDILVIVLCCNDASMLRAQPPTLEGIAETWNDFQPLLRTAFRHFCIDWRAGGGTTRIAVVYFDRDMDYAGLRPASVVRLIAEENGLVFIDGTQALAGIPLERYAVPTDGHPNAASHDLVARHVARALTASGWIPASSGFDSPAWIDRTAGAARLLASAGVPSGIAHSWAAHALRQRGSHRRSGIHDHHRPHYEAALARVGAEERRAWQPYALTALAMDVEARFPSADWLADVESRGYEEGALIYALEHRAATGSLGQPVDGLPLRPVACSPELARERLARLVPRIEARRRHADDLLAAIADADPDRTIAPVQQLAALAARWLRLEHVLATRIARCDQVLGRLAAGDPDLDRVMGTLTVATELTASRLAHVDRVVGWEHLAESIRGFAPNEPVMRLTLAAIAEPGPDALVFRLDLTSAAPPWHEPYLACGTFIADRRTHEYAFEIPLALFATLRIHVWSAADHDLAQRLRLLPAVLDIRSLATSCALAPPQVDTPLSHRLRLTYDKIFPLRGVHAQDGSLPSSPRG